MGLPVNSFNESRRLEVAQTPEEAGEILCQEQFVFAVRYIGAPVTAKSPYALEETVLLLNQTQIVAIEDPSRDRDRVLASLNATLDSNS